MEPILVVLTGWWWIAPAAVGAGAATYAGLTTRTRRARRLELDAARHEESLAYRALVAAKARVRTAQADVLSAKSRGAAAAATPAADARRELQAAKQGEKSASLELRASRSRVKAGYSQYRAAASGTPLPIDRLSTVHDAVNARWLSYETDVDKALAFPQMTDTRRPATVVFLRAQREALVRRPLLRDRVTPEQFAEYRVAVRALETALLDAERQAGVHGAPAGPPAVASTAATISAAATALADLAERLPSLLSRVQSPRESEPPADRAP